MDNNLIKKFLVVFNPYASFGKAKKKLQLLCKSLEINNIDYEIQYTEYKGHAIEIIKNTDFNNYKAIIAAGGDGTLFEVVNGYYQNLSGIKIPIGIIPVGTGNSFALDLNLKTNDLDGAIKIIVKNNPQLTDVAKCTFNNNVFYFMNVAGLGFITDVMKTTLKIKFLGNIAYSIAALWQIMFLKPYNIELEVDGKKFLRKNIFMEISNTRYTSNFLMAPNASFDDGFLDITLLNPLGALKMIKYFPSIFKGEHIHKKEIETCKAKRILISTENKKILGPDGELFGETPLEIECLHKDIAIFRP